MNTFLFWYSIIITLLAMYLYWEPKFELKLVQTADYDYYTLYMYYLHEVDAEECEYRCKRIFEFKKKIKTSDKRRT